MTHKINKISDLKKEKKRLKALGEEQVKDLKQSLHLVKDEGKHVLVKKILIPVGAAIVAGYGLKKLVDLLQSEKDETTSGYFSSISDDNPPAARQQAEVQNKQSNGLFSNVDWAAMAVRAAPFILSVGKKLYEEGNLPFFDPPDQSGAE